MRIRGLFVVLVAAALLGGCSASDTGADANGKDDGDTTAAEEIVAQSYDVMPLDAHAEQALTFMPATVDQHIALEIEDGAIEGEDYVDVRGIEPVFVGYQVVAWEPGDGDDVEYVDVEYMNGHIAFGLATPETERTRAPDVDTYHVMNTRPIPDSPSEGETAALDAARAMLDEMFPDREWEYGLKRYLFLYDAGGIGMVIGTTLEGDAGVYSQAITLAE